MEHNENLPDVTKWMPQEGVGFGLKKALLTRCQNIEKHILAKVEEEKAYNVENFDSGIAIETIVREELKKLLPSRYGVTSCIIDDRFGRTSGAHDIVIVNNQWFPHIKGDDMDNQRNIHYPIEAVYAVIEVKQTLSYKTLDSAMEKLVKCHRLYRPNTSYTRLTENRRSHDDPTGTTNPLFTAIISPLLSDGITIDDIIERFFLISKGLYKRELVRSFCVLEQGMVSWGYNEGNEVRSAYFMSDLGIPVMPVYHKMGTTASVFYDFLIELMVHLNNSILAPEDIMAFYGYGNSEDYPEVKYPTDGNHFISPGNEDYPLKEVI